MAVQDDRREREMRSVFELEDGKGRGGTDAFLELDDEKIPFELKSSTDDSFTTGRDVGQLHFEKWRQHQWLLSRYDRSGEKLLYTYYAPPCEMEPVIADFEKYIEPDIQLAKLLAERISEADVKRVLGDRKLYTLQDARVILKRQKGHGTADQFRNLMSLMDVPNGYSITAMVGILRERARYLLARGATLNNPHIPEISFKNCAKISANNASRLRQLVRSHRDCPKCASLFPRARRR